MKAADIMTRAVVTIAPSAPILDAIRLMLGQRISGLPVVDDGKLVGILSEGDLLRRAELGTERHRPRWLFAAKLAGLMGLDGPARAVLTHQVLEIAGRAEHDQLLVRLGHDTLSSHGQPTSQTELAAALDECAKEARRQLLDGLPMPSEDDAIR